MAIRRRSIGSVLFDSANAFFLVFLCIVMLYPLYYVLVASLSDGFKFMGHTGLLWGPVGFSTAAYRMVFNNPMVIRGFFNSVYLVVVGTGDAC